MCSNLHEESRLYQRKNNIEVNKLLLIYIDYNYYNLNKQ